MLCTWNSCSWVQSTVERTTPKTGLQDETATLYIMINVFQEFKIRKKASRIDVMLTASSSDSLTQPSLRPYALNPQSWLTTGKRQFPFRKYSQLLGFNLILYTKFKIRNFSSHLQINKKSFSCSFTLLHLLNFLFAMRYIVNRPLDTDLKSWTWKQRADAETRCLSQQCCR